MSFDFPTHSLYGVAVDISAPFASTVRARQTDHFQSLASLQHSLIGAWELVSYYAPLTTNPDDVFYPLGEEAKGIIIYHPDGYMSTSLLRPGQEAFNMSDTLSLAEATKRYLSYVGPFTLQWAGDKPTVRHRMALVNLPSWIGNVQTRVAKIEGDYLTLGLDSYVDMQGAMRNPTMVWRRLPPLEIIQNTSVPVVTIQAPSPRVEEERSPERS